MLNLVLFGPPGAGKGTQSERLIAKYNLIHLSTGDLLRAEIKGGTELGKAAQQYTDNGLLVPDEVVIGMIDNKIKANKTAPGFIFDGFPRTVPQAGSLDQICTLNGISISGMVSLGVDEEELSKRIQLRSVTSGRPDDQDPELIRQRISEYNKKTAPVADFYAKQHKFHQVDGMNSIDQVFDDICKVVDDLKQKA